MDLMKSGETAVRILASESGLRDSSIFLVSAASKCGTCSGKLTCRAHSAIRISGLGRNLCSLCSGEATRADNSALISPEESKYQRQCKNTTCVYVLGGCERRCARGVARMKVMRWPRGVVRRWDWDWATVVGEPVGPVEGEGLRGKI